MGIRGSRPKSKKVSSGTRLNIAGSSPPRQKSIKIRITSKHGIYSTKVNIFFWEIKIILGYMSLICYKEDGAHESSQQNQKDQSDFGIDFGAFETNFLL